MSTYRETTGNFVRSASGVISAVDLFKTAASDGDPGLIEFTADSLVKAVDEYLGTTEQFGRMGLDELAGTPDLELPKRERLAGDVLASALLDVEMSNTLLIAGQVAGETDESVPVETLEEAAGQLDSFAKAAALPMGRDVTAAVTTARFGLDEVPAAAPTAASDDVAIAKAGFEKRVAEIFDALVAETKKVFDMGFKGVKDLDDEALSQAIDSLGATVKELPTVGKLVTKGLQLAAMALDKLTGLLGKESVDALKGKAQEIVDKIKEGGAPVDKFLAYSYGIDAAKAEVQTRLKNTPADAAKINGGSKELAELQTRFAEQMALIARIAKGLNTAKKLVGKLLLPEVTAVVLFGTFYVVAMDYAVLAGMDYADTTKLLCFVEGVLKISEKTLS